MGQNKTEARPKYTLLKTNDYRSVTSKSRMFTCMIRLVSKFIFAKKSFFTQLLQKAAEVFDTDNTDCSQLLDN